MAKLLFLTTKPQLPLPSLYRSPTPPSHLSLLTHHQHHHHKRCKLSLTPKFSNSRNGSTQPSGTEWPVPLEQQPIIECQNLSTSSPFSWASGDFVEFISRLFVTSLSFALLVGLPVSWFGTIGSEPDLVKLALSSVSSGLFAVTLVVVGMHLGWAYVGSRLLSATVEYEETGWYDGQIWVKTAKVLARDRLLGSFQATLSSSISGWFALGRAESGSTKIRLPHFRSGLGMGSSWVMSEASPEQIEKFPHCTSNGFVSMRCAPCKL